MFTATVKQKMPMPDKITMSWENTDMQHPKCTEVEVDGRAYQIVNSQSGPSMYGGSTTLKVTLHKIVRPAPKPKF